MFVLNVDDVIEIPFRTYDQLFEQGDSCAIIQAYVDESSDIDTVTDDLEERLGNNYFIVSPKAALHV